MGYNFCAAKLRAFFYSTKFFVLKNAKSLEVEDEDSACGEGVFAREPGAEEGNVLAFEHVEGFVLG